MNKPIILMLASAVMLLGACSSDENKTDEPVINEVQGTPDTPAEIEPLPEITSLDLTADERLVMDELTTLAFDFSRQVAASGLSSSNKGNHCVSPASLAICLNLQCNSVDAPYGDKLADFFGLNDRNALSSLALKLQAYLPASGCGAVMKLANSLWYSSRYSTSEEYTGKMNLTFRTPVSPLDFSDTDLALKTINTWCSDHTDGLISNFLSELNPDVAAVWVNALYFEGTWISPFDKNLSTDAIFHGISGDRMVNMMHNSLTIDYSNVDGAEYAALPFDGSNYVLEVISGTQLSPERYSLLRQKAQAHVLKLSIPSFSIDWKAPLSTVYKGLDGLMNGATLTTMGFPEYVEATGMDIVHATSFTMNEEGARAAAVTGNWMTTAGPEAPQYPEATLTIDRPFTFIIRDTRSGAIVFIGVVNNI